MFRVRNCIRISENPKHLQECFRRSRCVHCAEETDDFQTTLFEIKSVRRTVSHDFITNNPTEGSDSEGSYRENGRDGTHAGRSRTAGMNEPRAPFFALCTVITIITIIIVVIGVPSRTTTSSDKDVSVGTLGMWKYREIILLLLLLNLQMERNLFDGMVSMTENEKKEKNDYYIMMYCKGRFRIPLTVLILIL